MIVRPLLAAAFVLSTWTLSSCASGVLYEDRLPGGIESWYDYGAAGRDLELVVLGNPFGENERSFRSRVEEAVRVQTLLAPTRPTLSPSASARPPFRLAVAFAPAGGDAVCTGRAVPVERPAEAWVPVTLAFCRADKVIAEVAARLDGVSGSGDPAFGNTLGSAMAVLFKRDLKDSGFDCPNC